MTVLRPPAQRAAIVRTYPHVRGNRSTVTDLAPIIEAGDLPMGTAMLGVYVDPTRERYLVMVTHPALAPVAEAAAPPERTLEDYLAIVAAWDAAIGQATGEELTDVLIAGTGPDLIVEPTVVHPDPPELTGPAAAGHATSATPGAEVAGRVPPLTSSPEEDSQRPSAPGGAGLTYGQTGGE